MQYSKVIVDAVEAMAKELEKTYPHIRHIKYNQDSLNDWVGSVFISRMQMGLAMEFMRMGLDYY